MRGAPADEVRGAGLRWPVVSLLILLVISKLVAVAQPSAQAIFVLGCFVVPAWWASGRGRLRLLQLRWWLLAIQAALTYLPFAVLGNGWVGGMSGFLAALVLLIVASPWRWVVLVVVVGVELSLWLGVVGLPYQPAANAGPWVAIALLDNALAFFGLSALADVVTDLHRTRTEVADRSVARLRLSASARLRSIVDERIQLVAAQTRAALRRLSSDTDTGSDANAGRAEIAAAAANARAVVAAARTLVDSDPDDAVGAAPGESSRDGSALAPRLARGVLAGLLTGFALQNLLNAAIPYGADAWLDHRATAIAVAVVASVAVPLLQWRHSTTPPGTRPRHWQATLTVMTVLAFATFPFVGPEGVVLVTFVSGSILLLVPGRQAWFWFTLPLAAAVVLSVAGRHDLSHTRASEIVAYAAGASSIAIMVFGLSVLTTAVAELDDARSDLAALAVVHEQVRLAQDTHDLLGLGLSALALKADLAGALIDHDTVRARRELADMLRVCAAVRTDAAGITADTIRLTLGNEIAVATDILTASGVDARLPTSVPDLPADVDALLARVVREAITNALRHGGGRQVSMEFGDTLWGLVLRITNDVGSNSARPMPADGRGLRNLEHRLADHGGRLTAITDADNFVLTVGLPAVAARAPTPVPGCPQPDSRSRPASRPPFARSRR